MNLTFKRDDLLDLLTDTRQRLQREYDAAIAAWEVAIRETVEEQIVAGKTGRVPQNWFSRTLPIDSSERIDALMVAIKASSTDVYELTASELTAVMTGKNQCGCDAPF